MTSITLDDGGLGGNRTEHPNVPIYEVNVDLTQEYPNGDTLPSIWITSSEEAGNGNTGRVSVTWYPYFARDWGGDDALYYGGCYYEEGMGYADSADREARIACFQAAELLYRHSAGQGNALANLCLGYVYSYDRCEGRYWDSAALSEWRRNEPYPREERAFACLSIAAAADIPEACYKLGDMYKHGTGCDPNLAEAFRWYVRASELSANESPVILGSVALRLGECHEEGLGCKQDFTRALSWYRQAAAGLEAAIDGGETWYEKALASARAGVKRCMQEATLLAGMV